MKKDPKESIKKPDDVNLNKVSLLPNKFSYNKKNYENYIDTFIVSHRKWYIRLWYLISNPFRYLFKGVWKI
jgi:hypothetical protein